MSYTVSIFFQQGNLFHLISFLRQAVGLAGEISQFQHFHQTSCHFMKENLISFINFLKNRVRIWEDKMLFHITSSHAQISAEMIDSSFYGFADQSFFLWSLYVSYILMNAN